MWVPHSPDTPDDFALIYPFQESSHQILTSFSPPLCSQVLIQPLYVFYKPTISTAYWIQLWGVRERVDWIEPTIAGHLSQKRKSGVMRWRGLREGANLCGVVRWASEEVILSKGLNEVRDCMSISGEKNFWWNTKCKGPKQKQSYPVLWRARSLSHRRREVGHEVRGSEGFIIALGWPRYQLWILF